MHRDRETCVWLFNCRAMHQRQFSFRKEFLKGPGKMIYCKGGGTQELF